MILLIDGVVATKNYNTERIILIIMPTSNVLIARARRISVRVALVALIFIIVIVTGNKTNSASRPNTTGAC